MKKRIFDAVICDQTEGTKEGLEVSCREMVRAFNLRLFDDGDETDDGGDAASDGEDTGEDGQEGAGGSPAAPLTQADIDKAVSAALKRERAKAEKKAREAAEAERLKNLSATERQAEQLKNLEEELATLKAEKARGAMASTVRGMLGSAGVSGYTDAIVNALIVPNDAEQTKANVDAFVRDWKASVTAGVKKAMSGTTPPAGNTRKAGGKALTKAEILAVKDQTERQRLIRENMELFRAN